MSSPQQLPPKKRSTNSFGHKLNRIRNQEAFKHRKRSQFNSLTKREREVIQLLVEGYNNPQVAAVLIISRNTVEQHRKNINRKLKVQSFPQLFEYALAFDLV